MFIQRVQTHSCCKDRHYFVCPHFIFFFYLPYLGHSWILLFWSASIITIANIVQQFLSYTLWPFLSLVFLMRMYCIRNMFCFFFLPLVTLILISQGSASFSANV